MSNWPKRENWHDGMKIIFEYEDYIMSVVQFTGSYGYRAGLWEVGFMDKATSDFVDPPIDFLSEYKKADPGIYGWMNDPDVDRCHVAMSQISEYLGGFNE
tara:strand:- start:271 stop:570 length:300 start_codon:yes stop_codon:yes gene_type:complete